jgi:NADH dehydrogenase FAD-containing subunit
MMMPRVVLAGEGHGHLHTLRRAAEYARHGIALTLVAPSPFRYSGMASGVLGGSYAPGENVIDASRWVVEAGGTVVRDEVVRVEPAARLVHLAGGPPLPYDVLSLSVGSTTALPAALAGAPAVVTVKPVEHLTLLHERLAARLAGGSRPRVVVAGGGASGCEVAANLLALADRCGGSIAVTLVHEGERLLPESTPAAAASVHRFLGTRGVDVLTGTRLTGFDGSRAGVERVAGAEPSPDIAADLVVAATGLRPPSLLAESGLPTAPDGSILVDDALRSTGNAHVFGVGDCVSLDGHDLPRIGVYAIRQAPVLHHNLIAAARGEPEAALRRFEPQQRYLLILNLGGGNALATRRSLHWQGRAAWWLKNSIDRRFISRYR